MILQCAGLNIVQYRRYECVKTDRSDLFERFANFAVVIFDVKIDVKYR